MVTRFEMYEDNGGALRLYVWDYMGGQMYLEMYEGLEYDVQNGEMLDVYCCLRHEDNFPAKHWMSADIHEPYVEQYDDDIDAWYRDCLAQDRGTSDLIADEQGIYPRRMGTAGYLAFGFKED